jgi:hypothetical protein
MSYHKERGREPSVDSSPPIVQVTFRDMLPDEATVRLALSAQTRLRALPGYGRRSAVVTLSPGPCADSYTAELSFSRGSTPPLQALGIPVRGRRPRIRHGRVRTSFALQLPELMRNASRTRRDVSKKLKARRMHRPCEHAPNATTHHCLGQWPPAVLEEPVLGGAAVELRPLPADAAPLRCP